MRRPAPLGRAPAAVTVGACVGLLGLQGCSEKVPQPVGMEGRLVARDFSFSPKTIVIQVGQQSSVLFENEDEVTHSFSTEDGGSVDVAAGSSRRIDLTVMNVPEKLTSTFTCRFHGFEGMKGTIRVQP